jgi:hypothetical protein
LKRTNQLRRLVSGDAARNPDRNLHT